jgi:nucleoid-associated protein YgaU
MYDSITPQDIPSDATMVAGYVDGRYANISAMRRRYPHSVVVGIAAFASTNDGIVLDVEQGDATPTQAVEWVVMRRHAGKVPTVYTSASEWNAVRAAFHAAGVAEPYYWIAQWDGHPSIPSGAIAKQYQQATRDHHYDVSVCSTYWPGVDPAPHGSTHTYTVHKGDTLSGIAMAHHLTLAQIEKMNPQIKHPDLIYPGQIVNV